MAKLNLNIQLELPSQLKGFEPQQCAQAFAEIYQDYEFEIMEEVNGINVAQHKKDVDQKLIEKGMQPMKGARQYFRNEKLEKLSIGWTIIRDAMVVSGSVGWPTDDYDFPVLGITWDESEKHVHFIGDFMPLTDLVINEEYLVNYLDPFEPVYRKYTDLLDAPPEHLSWFRALSSPYVIAGRPKAGNDRAQIKKALNCLCQYIRYWLDEIVAKAEPITDPEYKAQVKAKKEKIRDIYRRNDPGGAVLNALIGQELAWRGLQLLF